MSKVICLVLCAVVCFGLFCGCGKDDTPSTQIQGEFEFAVVTEEEKTGIEALWLREMGSELSWDRGDIPQKSYAGYLGKIGDYSLIFVTETNATISPIPEQMQTITVAGYSFTFYASFNIYLCGSEMICDLERAYQQGMISKEQIGQLPDSMYLAVQ